MGTHHVAMNHIVLLSFKDLSTAAPLFAALDELRTKVPGITSYTHGAYSSPEGLNRGYTHAFVYVFSDAEARDGYLIHPAHEKLKSDFLPLVEQVLAFDFES